MISDTINASIIQAHVPHSMKAAIVRPLLKKSSLDVDILSSYGPVRNLTQVSKFLEKVIEQQLMEHTSEMTELYQLTCSSSSRSLDQPTNETIPQKLHSLQYVMISRGGLIIEKRTHSS